jgi:hypothetical protein
MGLGVNLVPAWVNIVGQKSYPNEGNFWPIDPNWSPGYRGQSLSLSHKISINVYGEFCNGIP